MSGDLGRLDANGNLEVVGRLKDLIIRGGHNIYPSQIEDLAIRHPLVFKAAAFPIDDPRLGERACLAVIIGGGESVTAVDMLAHLFDAGLSKYDMPEYFLCLEEFPLTASGKVLKRTLMQRVRAGELAPEKVRWQATTTSGEA
jgi:acyl-CoA synthetase